MGFLHQLHLLLWKNVTLKRRSPWVLAFEIFIPLVLFFILLGLRQKKPTISVKEAYYTAAPLTSAGILPVMQSLCPDGQRDELGFLQYSNSTVTQLLERLNEVVEKSNLFDPDHAGLEEELESLRRHLESLSSSEPNTMETHFSNRAAPGFTLDSTAKDKLALRRFLAQNLSLSNETAELLAGSEINLKEVYRLFFGTSPVSAEGFHEPWDRFSTAEKLLHLEESLLGSWRTAEDGLVRQALRRPQKSPHKPAFLHLLSHALGLASPTPEPSTTYSPPTFVKDMENILFTAAVLESLTCQPNQDELGRILLVPESRLPLLRAYQAAACNKSAGLRKEYFGRLAAELKEQLDAHKIIRQLKLDEVNGTAAGKRLHAVLEDLTEMEKVLKDVDILSALAKLLPKGACSSRPPAATSNSTSPAGNFTSGTNASAEEGKGESEAPAEDPQGQCSAFVQLWAGLQPILCGNNRTIEPEALKQGNMSSLGFTSKEQRNLGLLVHLMTSNPKILYAPVGTEVDKVILKANETFAFVGNVTRYAQVWMNMSAEIRSSLEEGRLQQRISRLQQIAADLRKRPEILNVSDGHLLRNFLDSNFSLPNASVLLQQLDTIDNAACGWIQFVSKVSVDIFKGFPDEESIVNYTLNQAYQDNVTVFASVIFQTNKDGTLPPHVMYKIRQNSSFTEKTNEIRRAYWRPGPNTGGRFYFLYGFVWIQESCPRRLECALLRREFCLPGSYACGPCLSRFVEDGDGQCVPKARPAGGRPSAPNLEEEVDLVAEVLSKQDDAQRDGTPAPVGKHLRIGAPKSESSPKGQAGRPLATPSLRPEAIQRTPVEKALSSNDALILGMVAVCTAAGIAALAVAAVCWCRLQKEIRLAQKADYPAQKLPSYDKISPGDKKLAQSAQMYHYQHQKQQMLSMEKTKEEAKLPESASSDEENEDGDFTVYECPGLAPTGEMEVKNPLFDDASLRSPPTDSHP